MKINYSTLLEKNKEATADNGGQLSCYWVIQQSVERFMNGEDMSEQQTELLLDLGILMLSDEETHRQTIVGPFNFTGSGSDNI